MSECPVTCIHFADRSDMSEASTIIGSQDRDMPYLTRYDEMVIVLKCQDGIKASRFLAAAGIQPTFVEHRTADSEEAEIFASMDDAPMPDHYGEVDEGYASMGGMF